MVRSVAVFASLRGSAHVEPREAMFGCKHHLRRDQRASHTAHGLAVEVTALEQADGVEGKHQCRGPLAARGDAEAVIARRCRAYDDAVLQLVLTPFEPAFRRGELRLGRFL